MPPAPTPAVTAPTPHPVGPASAWAAAAASASRQRGVCLSGGHWLLIARKPEGLGRSNLAGGGHTWAQPHRIAVEIGLGGAPRRLPQPPDCHVALHSRRFCFGRNFPWHGRAL